MIKIIINDTDGADKVKCFSDFCLIAAFILGVLCLFTNVLAFLQWMYDWSYFRFTTMTGTLCIGFFYTYRQCQKAIAEYNLTKSRKV